MTQEEKQLLFQDLCARLPYSPKCEMIDELRVVNNEREPSYISVLLPKHIELFSFHNNFTIKPYLRSLSSMTEEEKEKVCLISQDGNIEYHYGVFYRCQDYLNSIHVDYRGLIEKGLALEAPDGMCNNK